MANLADLVRQAAAAHAGKAAVVAGDRELSWADLDAAVDRAAGAYVGLGLVPGDRVALALGNVPEFAVAYFGALRAGLVALPVNTSYTPAELTHLVADSGARASVVSRALAETYVELARQDNELGHVLVAATNAAPEGSRVFDEMLSQASPYSGDAAAGDEDLAVLIYTSGTSGRPKGAMLSHRALLANLQQIGEIQPPLAASDDVVLLVLPLFHIYGLNFGLGLVAYAGATGVLVERFDPTETLTQIRRHGVSSVVGVPQMYIAWSMLPDVDDAMSSVRLAVSGAAPLPPAVLLRVLETTGHHIFEGYGLTETAPAVTTTLMSEVAKPGSIGRPIPGVELRLLDESGEEVDEDDPGEIVVRGANLFSGYWPDGADGPDEQGWWRTGDVAYADNGGDLFLVDRRRELILVSGFNVYPREVEEVLARHPDIAEAAVIGIAHPYTGESVKALVVLRPGARLSAEDVIDWCAVSLARFKCPTAVEFRDELPHSATGKVSKGRLREIGLDAAGSAAGPG
ncbi:MAG: AMP-binding protein [Actinomycetota bacterium]|nr:AMP-binding protein [Actinomycetota bacterium]